MKNDVRSKQIVALAKALKLNVFAEYKAYVEENSSVEEALYNLLTAENSIKEQNKYNYRIKNAAFPVLKTLDTFVFDEKRLPELKKETVMELATCEFIEKKQNVVAIGNSGTGKSHLMTALGIEAITRGYTVKFRRASELVAQMNEAVTERHLSKLIKKVNACNVLLLDELGYLVNAGVI